MSIEQAVREKQAFDVKVKEFLKYVAAMTIDEIEIILGRLADMLAACTNETDRDHVTIKGQILKMYYDLRKINVKCQSKDSSVMLSSSEHPSVIAWYNQMSEEQRKWDEERHALPFLKRLITGKYMSGYRHPKFPDISESEKLIHHVASFRLIPEGSGVPGNVNTQSLMLLAP